MRNLRRLLPAAIFAAALLADGPGVCTAEDDLGFEMILDAGEIGDYMVGDFIIDGAIQDEGSAFGEYVWTPDGTLDLQMTLFGAQDDLQLQIHDIVRHWNPDWSVTMSSAGFTLTGDAGVYEGVTGNGSASGEFYITDSWWSWGYPSERENWLLTGELTGPLPPPPPPALPELSIADVSILEGRRGTSNAAFRVTLSSASDETVSVEYATADGTALVSSNDYEAASGVLTFEAGQTTATITVQINGDRRREPDERFYVDLVNPASATLADPEAVGTILNDD